MPPRPCATHRTLIPAGQRCPQCRQAAELRRATTRPTTAQRGLTGAWRRIVKQVLERDNYLCQLRLPGCLGAANAADHIVPRHHGGTNHMTNLQAACKPCNSRKGHQ